MRANPGPLEVSRQTHLQNGWLPRDFGRQNVMDAKKPSRV